MSYWRGSSLLCIHTFLKNNHTCKLDNTPASLPVFRLEQDSFKYFLPGCWAFGFFASVRAASWGKGNAALLSNAPRSTPSRASQPIRPAVGSGSRALPPEGLQLARAPRSKAKVRVQLWQELMKFKAGCSWSRGAAVKGILPPGQLQNKDFATCKICSPNLHVNFLSFLQSSIAMHLETLQNFYLYIAHWGENYPTTLNVWK